MDIEPMQGVRTELQRSLAAAAAQIGPARTAEICMLLNHAEDGVALEHLATYLLLASAEIPVEDMLRLQRTALALGLQNDEALAMLSSRPVLAQQ